MLGADEINILEKCLLDSDYLFKTNSEVDRLVNLRMAGYNKLTKSSKKKKKEADYLMKIASLRLRARRRYSLWNRLWFDEYTIMYSTPEYAGKYRSERLKGNTIHDLGAGSGMQSVMFSMHSEVTGVEENRERTLMAQLNAKAYGSKAKFLNIDAIEYISSGGIDSNDIVFSDPVRLRNKNGWNLVPDPELIQKRLTGICDNICFDLPPRTPVDKIPMECEAEYMSFNGNIVRLTRYQGKIVEAESTAVILPEGITVSGKRKKWFPEPGDSGRYVCIPDPAVVSSHLLYTINEYGEFHLGDMDERRMLLLSQSIPTKGFPGSVYEVLVSGGIEDMRKVCMEMHPRQLIPRFNLPDFEYYHFIGTIMPDKSDGPPLYLHKMKSKYLAAVKIKI